MDDWTWEGNVAQAVAAHLRAEGWTIRAIANTATRETGVDVLAVRDDVTLAVEVKGYPATVYARGPKAGQPKPTRPANQARHWYSHAWFEGLLMHDRDPQALVVLAFPDMPTFRRLIDRTRGALERLGFGVFLVANDGKVKQLIEGRPLDW